MDTREEIEKALSVLIGQPFWKARRTVNMAMFDFGERHPSTNRKGQPIEYGEYVLHISCHWRFTQLDQIVVGSRDLFYPPDGSANPLEDFDWDTEMGNLYDVRMKMFMEEHANQPLFVTSIEAGRAGSVSIFFNENYALDISQIILSLVKIMWSIGVYSMSETSISCLPETVLNHKLFRG